MTELFFKKRKKFADEIEMVWPVFVNILYLNLCCCFMQILKINPSKKDINSFVASDFKLVGYDPHQKIEMKMAI